MRIVHSIADLERELQQRRGAAESIALVPTLGNLHAGHVSLIRRARALARCVVVSVFVNPLQFGPNDDFERYPRTLDADARLIEAEGVQLLFAPTVADMYPGGYPPATSVQVAGALDSVLEGEFRPGHFAGVATVVNILFNRVRPDVAVFGEKDYQQLAVIRRMVVDLGLSVRIEGSPTLRDADGLALSSRNQYLQPAERALAPQLQAVLRTIAQGLRDGRRDFDTLCAQPYAQLQESGFRPQYLAVRAPDLSPPDASARRFVVLAAAYLGNTRLIDNLSVNLDVQ
ncbi:MAG: pantoate--beta-alanine ligase [Nevskia sp.]|nr:pantoate--beta-alanine ligase [Nevskia sp.]